MSPCRSDYIFTDREISVWRVVSEDSDHVTAWLAVIHCFHDLDDRKQPTSREMRVHLDYLHTAHELSEIQALRGSQRIFLEERNYLRQKITPPSNNELVQVFFVVVPSAVAVDTPNTEVLLHHLQALEAFRPLSNYKLMRHLETSFVTPSISSVRLSDEMD